MSPTRVLVSFEYLERFPDPVLVALSVDHAGFEGAETVTIAHYRDGSPHVISSTGDVGAEFDRAVCRWQEAGDEPSVAPPEDPERLRSQSLLAFPRVTPQALRDWDPDVTHAPDGWEDAVREDAPASVLRQVNQVARSLASYSRPDVTGTLHVAGRLSTLAATIDDIALVQDGPSPLQLLRGRSEWPEGHMLASVPDLAIIIARWAGLGPRVNRQCPLSPSAIETAMRLIAPGAGVTFPPPPSQPSSHPRAPSAPPPPPTEKDLREPWGLVHLTSSGGEVLAFVWTLISGFYRVTGAPDSPSIDRNPVQSRLLWQEIVAFCLTAAEYADHDGDTTWRHSSPAT